MGVHQGSIIIKLRKKILSRLQPNQKTRANLDFEAGIAEREARVKMLRQMAKTTESVDRTSCNHRM